eukprot:TRINITY_DN10842_c0_g1_i2.p1 TRINITY_DN10842_c0_g1~~TRINITY_DN10842_c0_g1_i2.p1  ORF type:complete len:500 (-),score=80.46 TRINITY_DN10842_c0_g1_i2:1171-2670(-)
MFVSSLRTYCSRTITPKSKSIPWDKISAAILLLGAGSLAFAYHDEGTRRSLVFWSGVTPIYLHYRYVQWVTRGKADEEISMAFDELHENYSPRVESLCLQLRGFYLKQAQLMSTLDDFVPPAYMRWCKKMQDEVPTEFGPGQAREIVERSLGKPIEEIFSRWNDIPRGAASIGQVHQATLMNGREVAVKIQFPNIEKRFRSDLKTLITFCSFALPQHVQPLEEMENQFCTEFDYVLEAENLNRVYSNVMPHWSSKVVIPRPVMSLCTKDVLVMDYLHGVRLIDGIRNNYREYAKEFGTTLEAMEAKQKEEMRLGTFKYRSTTVDKWRVKFYTVYLKTKDFLLNTPKFIYNWTFGFFTNRIQYFWHSPPINLGEIIETLHDVHAHQIFFDGLFNADPHPGNILLMEDGRLGLIDYGQVKSLGEKTRIQYAKLILAIARDDEEKMIDLLWNDIGKQWYQRRVLFFFFFFFFFLKFFFFFFFLSAGGITHRSLWIVGVSGHM